MSGDLSTDERVNLSVDVIEGLETGLDDYVTKPYSPDELAARVRTLLWRVRRDRGS